MEDKDWKRLRFVAREDTWFLPNYGVKLLGAPFGNTLTDDDIVESNCGLFEGMTVEFPGRDEPLEEPRLDEESCAFEEFDIFLGDEMVNEWTYGKLKARLALHYCTPPPGKYPGGMNGKGSHGSAFSECLELENGEMWITNDEYDSQVNFCPVCGVKARVGTELKGNGPIA